MDGKCDLWIARFVEHLGFERRLSRHTCVAYRRDLMRLGAYLEERGIIRWPEVSAADIRGFAAWLHRCGGGARSVQRSLASIRSFYSYLLREGVATLNPGTGVTAPRAARKLPRVLDVDHLSSLLRRQGSGALTLRDAAMLELFYSSGLRLAELVGTDLCDLDLREGLVEVIGKGGKARVLPVGREARDALVRWLAVRPTLARATETALFVSRRGVRVHARTVQARVARWAARSGTRLHPHMLRHSFARHMLL